MCEIILKDLQPQIKKEKKFINAEALWKFNMPILNINKIRVHYRNFPKISDRQSWANSETQIRLQSDQGLHCLQFPLHLLDAFL